MADCVHCGKGFNPVIPEDKTVIVNGVNFLTSVKCPHCSNDQLAMVSSDGKFRKLVEYGLYLSEAPVVGESVSADEEINALKEKIQLLESAIGSQEQPVQPLPEGSAFFLPKYYNDDGSIVERLPVNKFKRSFRIRLTKDLTTELFGSPIKAFSNEDSRAETIDERLKQLKKERKNFEQYVGLDKLILKEDGSIKTFTEIMFDYSSKLFDIFSKEISDLKQRVTLPNGLIGNYKSPVHHFPEPHLLETYGAFKSLIDLLSRNSTVKTIVNNRFGLINEAIDVYDDPFYNKKTAVVTENAQKILNEQGKDFSLQDAFSVIAWKAWVEGEDLIINQHLPILLDEINQKTNDYNNLELRIKALEKEKSEDVFDSDFYRVQARFLTDSKLLGYRLPKEERVSFIKRIFEEVPGPHRSLFDVKGTNLMTVLINNNQRPGDLTILTRDLLNATASKLVKNDCHEGLVITVYGKKPEINFIKDSFLDYLSMIKSSADHLSETFRQFFEGEQDFNSVESLIDNNLVHFYNLGVNNWDKLLKFFKTYESTDFEPAQEKIKRAKLSFDYFKGFGTDSWTGSELSPFNRPSLSQRLGPVKEFGKEALDRLLKFLKIRKDEVKPDSIDELKAYCDGPADNESIYLKLLRREPDNLRLDGRLDKVESGWSNELSINNLDHNNQLYSGLTPELFNNMARKVPVQERFNKQNAFLRTFYVDRENVKKWYAASGITFGAGTVFPPLLIASGGVLAYAHLSKYVTDRTLPEVIDFDSRLTLLSELCLKNKPIYFLPHLLKEKTELTNGV